MGKGKRDWWVLIGLALVAVTAIVASFGTLMHLAHWVGWQGWYLQIMLPICLDVLALASGRVWLSDSMTTEARRFARTVSMIAIGVSIVGNAIGHVVVMGNAPLGKILLAITIASIPPAALAAVGHLFTLTSLRTEEEAPVVEEAPEPVQDEIPAEPEEEPEPEPQPVQGTVQRRSEKEARARGYWDAERAEGRTPSGAELGRKARVDASMGCKYKKKFEAEDAANEHKTGTRALALVGN